MKDKNKVNITNILLLVITVMIGIIGYYFTKDQVQANETNKLVKELVVKVDTNYYANTAQHIVLFGEINSHIDKSKLVYDGEIKTFMKKAEIAEKENHKQDMKIQQNTDRSIDNKRRLDRYSHAIDLDDSLMYWYYGLK